MSEINPDKILPELTTSPDILSAVNAILQRNGKELTEHALLMLPCITNPRDLVIISSYPPLGQIDVEVRNVLSEAPTDREVYTRTCMLDAATGAVQEYTEGTQGGVFTNVVIGENDPKTLKPLTLTGTDEPALLDQKLNHFSRAEEQIILGYLRQV